MTSMNKEGQIRTLYAVAIATVVTGLVVGFGTYFIAVPAKPAPAVPKIGTLLAVTGDLAPYGGPSEKSARMAVDLINEHGGVLGKRLELVTGDTESKEAIAAEEMIRLCDVEKVPAVLGAMGSGMSFSALKVDLDYDVVMVSPSSTSPDFTKWGKEDRDEGLFWRTIPSDALQGRVIAKLAWDEGYRTANTLVLNNPYGVGFADVFVETFKKLGGKVLHRVKYDPAAKIFGATVEKAAEDKPDVIMFVGYPKTGSIIMKTAYEKGVMEYCSWLLSEGLHEEDFPEKVGKTPKGEFIIKGTKGTMPIARGPAYEKFREMYKGRYKKEPALFSANTFDGITLIALAMERAGEATSDAVKKNLMSVSAPPGVNVTDVGKALELVRKGEEINYEGAGGAVDFNKVGDVTSDYAIWQVTPEGGLRKVKVYTAVEIAKIGK